MSDLAERLRSARRKTECLKEWGVLVGATKTTLHRLAETSEAAADELDAKDALIADLLSTFSVRDDSGIMILEKDNQKFVAALVALSKASQD